MSINCIIIDDEPLALKGLEEYVQDIEYLHLSGTFDTPLKAMDILTEGNVQLMLLDIQMPKITGLEFLKTLKNPPFTILTTAYPEYALQAFELNILDYLLKPFSFDRFLKAVMKAKTLTETEQQPVARINEGAAGYFFLKTDSKLVKITHDEVLYVEALQNYVAVYTRERKHLSYLTIKSVEEQLPAHRFIKIHKSYLVAADKVESIEGNEIIIGAHRIPISRNNKEEVLEKILQNRLLKR